MSDMDQKRVYVADLYRGPGWKHKVAKMPDSQVLAIYLREQKKASEVAEKTAKVKENPDDIPF